MNSKGRVTIPTDIDVIEQTKEIAAKWGADALRDCDGTDFPQELKDSGLKVYSTYYTTRKDNEWAKQNPDEIQQMYIITPHVTAVSDKLQINLMKGLYPDILRPNNYDDIKRWWEVIDRTTGRIVPADQWSYDEETTTVELGSVAFHEYTVSFLAYILWDPVHMYNAVI
ncbi:MAG: 1,3-beta-galactosyl-N-acetylhexosamine phosphorylase N-terminal domain-containing protein, partial [Lachnospiraceae bacterium]|nr:1,3-beta-galactosyl-N-acetylhexosamine phosphorylase N-terminal domain-containing protein [Lachnospiraceae bacterium]